MARDESVSDAAAATRNLENGINVTGAKAGTEEWAKRSVPTISREFYNVNPFGGHGASAPLPALQTPPPASEQSAAQAPPRA
jgi:hypothetical protein